MADFGRELRGLLREYGCYPVRSGKGSHEIWHSPITGCNFTLVANCKVRHTANKILKDAGIEKAF